MKNATKIFICDECTVVFQVYGVTKRKGYYCPVCGENFATHHYQADRLSSTVTKIKWRPEELELLQECIKGKLKPYQVAIQLGRSTNAVIKKIARIKQE